jgi:hypothetical protein
MDSARGWCLILLLFHTGESRRLVPSHESTSTKSTVDLLQSQSTLATPVAALTTTVHSGSALQLLVTKPNSYLYNPEEDETPFERMKREAAPFVCKSKTFLAIPLTCRFARTSSRWLLSRSTKLSHLSHMHIRCRYRRGVWRRHSMGSDQEELRLGEYRGVQERTEKVGPDY